MLAWLPVCDLSLQLPYWSEKGSISVPLWWIFGRKGPKHHVIHSTYPQTIYSFISYISPIYFFTRTLVPLGHNRMYMTPIAFICVLLQAMVFTSLTGVYINKDVSFACLLFALLHDALVLVPTLYIGLYCFDILSLTVFRCNFWLFGTVLPSRIVFL